MKTMLGVPVQRTIEETYTYTETPYAAETEMNSESN